jgi:alpha/beta superfamily hydrolase
LQIDTLAIALAKGFISIAPPADLYDFSFLAPCPSSGLIIHGDKDAVVPPRDVTNLVEKLKTQKASSSSRRSFPAPTISSTAKSNR